jgi:hypothetical protein
MPRLKNAELMSSRGAFVRVKVITQYMSSERCVTSEEFALFFEHLFTRIPGSGEGDLGLIWQLRKRSRPTLRLQALSAPRDLV